LDVERFLFILLEENIAFFRIEGQTLRNKRRNMTVSSYKNEKGTELI